jgi:hypothetical protein
METTNNALSRSEQKTSSRDFKRNRIKIAPVLMAMLALLSAGTAGAQSYIDWVSQHQDIGSKGYLPRVASDGISNNGPGTNISLYQIGTGFAQFHYRTGGAPNLYHSDALVRGDGLSAASRAEITRPSLHITTAGQFPLFQPDLQLSEQRKDLFSGLGVIVFDGPQGRGFYKGGHDGQTANTMVCIEGSQNCVLILSNDVRSEAGFAELIRFILGDTSVPYDWEYGDHAGKS